MALTNTAGGPHHGQPVLVAGEPVETAKAAVIMVHGRGGSAADVLTLTQYLETPGLAFLAPQASQNTWYPYSFLTPIDQNEPHLTSALATVDAVLALINEAGRPPEKTVLLGFSQGACLASEFVARHARRYGGLIVFSGGLIGPPGTPRNYLGSLEGMPIFLGCSDIDPHIPQERVHESQAVFEKMGAVVTTRIYPNMGHMINQDEIDHAHRLIEAVVAS